MKKLFVGKLSYHTTETELHSLFAEFGPIQSVRIISDKMTGRSRGFGFVELQDDAKADEAIQALNNAQMDGMKIVVNEARPSEGRPSFSGGRQGGGYRPGSPSRFRDNRGSDGARFR